MWNEKWGLPKNLYIFKKIYAAFVIETSQLVLVMKVYCFVFFCFSTLLHPATEFVSRLVEPTDGAYQSLSVEIYLGQHKLSSP